MRASCVAYLPFDKSTLRILHMLQESCSLAFDTTSAFQFQAYLIQNDSLESATVEILVSHKWTKKSF